MTESLEKEGNETYSQISFGKAGTLYLGTDAELLQGCDAIEGAYNKFFRRRRPGDDDCRDYNAACLAIEARAKIIAPIPATSMAGIRAKAHVVGRLCKIGMASYAGRILATSLAEDVLALGDQS